MSVMVRETQRFLWLALRAMGRGVVDFYNSSNLTFASSIAYYSLLSFFPFVLLSLDILGRTAVVHGDATFLRIVAYVLPSHFDFVVQQVDELSRAPLKLSVFGTFVMIWASMGVFGAITTAVNYAWGTDRPLNFFRHKLIAFLMLMAAGVLLLVTLVLMSVIQVNQSEWFERLLEAVPAMRHMEGFVYRHVTTPLCIFVIALIYYFVPRARVRLRDVWVGAILAGILWRVAFSVFSWWVRDFSRFSVHGSIAAVVAFLIWVYMSAVILLYGVEVSAAFARLDMEGAKVVPPGAD
jgi:membrane protein